MLATASSQTRSLQRRHFRHKHLGGRVEGWAAQLDSPPSTRWARLIALTCEHGHRAVCGGDLVGDHLGDLIIEAVVEVDSESG